MCADGEAAAVRQVKASSRERDPSHGKEEKRKDVRRSQQRQAQDLAVFAGHRLHLASGAPCSCGLRIYCNKKTHTYRLKDDSRRKRRHERTTGAEGRGETEAGRGDVNQGRWDRLERVCLKKMKCQSDGGSVRGLSGSGQVWGTRKKVTEEKGQLLEQACSAKGHPTRKGGRRKEEK